MASASPFFDIEPLDGGESSFAGHAMAMNVCSLSRCGKRLTGNCDIFMYRGDKPFCSEECRYQQMEMDQASVAVRISATTTTNARNEQRHRLEPGNGNVAVAANVPVLS
ncbi:hypothetical protein GUJ93_ZPchr0006g46198 [Zizania palustris]|uniref:FLZ-type domain-containing protein n=1 Tax=Zizania palustris TaxID=103762 RepID=A0A8J5SGD6_ZIZPA|nr:hypothetical protein GUJ93_ZPchr0006g46198 [Zizania palustris]